MLRHAHEIFEVAKIFPLTTSWSYTTTKLARLLLLQRNISVPARSERIAVDIYWFPAAGTEMRKPSTLLSKFFFSAAVKTLGCFSSSCICAKLSAYSVYQFGRQNKEGCLFRSLHLRKTTCTYVNLVYKTRRGGGMNASCCTKKSYPPELNIKEIHHRRNRAPGKVCVKHQHRWTGRGFEKDCPVFHENYKRGSQMRCRDTARALEEKNDEHTFAHRAKSVCVAGGGGLR